ncbi:MAG: LLM class flavin-dependent oxidoreductase [Actinomycetia bacterium]|nr:LLM class flavin-dependent oxidoreductase [Actinomycetes bacterium]MCP3911339.1 LLM class flavin-dependent oxidoreductase [Actinomycetes bacterium]MCP4085712.1 LLM class flavin-dependent oxidoreductase [Actinomycetes bacterium]
MTDRPDRRFALYDLTEHREGTALSQLFEERFELLAAAEDAGFVAYHTTEHHLNPVDATPSPNIFLAAAAQRTSRIRLATLVNVLPLYDPIRLVEEWVMVDHLSSGRLEVGVGKGVSAVELEMMGHDPTTSRASFEGRLDQIVEGLTTGVMAGAPLPARPAQSPHPPLWYAGGAEYAGRRNLHVMLGGSTDRVAEGAALHAQLVAEQVEPERRLNGGLAPTVGMGRHVLMGTDANETRRRAGQAWAVYHQNLDTHFERTGAQAETNPGLGGDADLAMAVGALVAGSPGEVRAELARQLDRTGIDYLAVSFCWGDLDHTEAMASMQRFATEVMPALR